MGSLPFFYTSLQIYIVRNTPCLSCLPICLTAVRSGRAAGLNNLIHSLEVFFMEYTILQRANPLNRTKSKKFFASPIWSTVITIRVLANEISKSCTLTAADVVAVLESFLQLLPSFLKNGHSVRLGDFGIFKLSFSAIGQDFKGDVSAEDISNVRVLFRPSVQLKKELQDNLTFIKRELL